MIKKKKNRERRGSESERERDEGQREKERCEVERGNQWLLGMIRNVGVLGSTLSMAPLCVELQITPTPPSSGSSPAEHCTELSHNTSSAPIPL